MERPGVLLARRTRTIRMCSFDGRSGTSTGATPKERSNELAWKNHFRPVEKTPGTFSL